MANSEPRCEGSGNVLEGNGKCSSSEDTNSKKVEQLYYLGGQSFSNLDRRWNQPRHSLKLTLTQGRVLTFFHSVRAEGGEEAIEGKSEARRGR